MMASLSRPTWFDFEKLFRKCINIKIITWEWFVWLASPTLSEIWFGGSGCPLGNKWQKGFVMGGLTHLIFLFKMHYLSWFTITRRIWKTLQKMGIHPSFLTKNIYSMIKFEKELINDFWCFLSEIIFKSDQK